MMTDTRESLTVELSKALAFEGLDDPSQLAEAYITRIIALASPPIGAEETRESLARKMLDARRQAEGLDPIEDAPWNRYIERRVMHPNKYIDITAAYAQADLALSLAIELAEAQQALLPPWTPAMQQAFGAWLKVTFPHELDSKSIMSLGDAWQAGWEAGHFNEMLTRPAQREPVERVSLALCPVGLFRSDAGSLCVKTEYVSSEGRIDAYIVPSGEFFCGTPPQTIANQRQQMVTPVPETAFLATPPTPAQREPAGEPVAWLMPNSSVATTNKTQAEALASLGYAVTPLYASPQPPASERTAVLEEFALKCAETYGPLENGEEGWECMICHEQWNLREFEPLAHLEECPIHSLATRLPNDTQEGV